MNLNLSDQRANAQIRTFRIFKSLPKYDLIHLADEAKLEPSHYNTHARRAAGLTVLIYKMDGLMNRTRRVLDHPFKP